MKKTHEFDYIIIGSGFGGSVSALRLSEKGYRVLVIEKGKRLGAKDFPKTNWHLKKWLWLPPLRFFGLFRINFFRHITVLTGVGVGGGSLVYANTLPIPDKEFFEAKSWSNLADWENELKPFYQIGLKMLGVSPNPLLKTGDLALKELAKEIGREDQFEIPNVGVFFGEPDITVPDPYFNGDGPERTGCNFCGGCMVGCRYNAKNSLDKNYLYLAEKNGAKIHAEAEVYDVKPINSSDGSDGYTISWKSSTKLIKQYGKYTSQGVIFAGGVLGTVKLLLELKHSSLPNLSNKVGLGIRTNSESLIGVTTLDKDTVFSDGIAIGSLLHTDKHSSMEPVRYNSGSGFWRLLQSPMVHGSSALNRIWKILTEIVRHPINNFRIYFVNDWAKKTQIILFMQTLDSKLRFTKGKFGLRTSIEQGKPPSAFIPEAKNLVDQYSKIVHGKPRVLLTETLFGIPTTAHILGGAIMGISPSEGVIDKDHNVFGYKNMMICDGSSITANPGVNPSLTITALAERAISKIPPKLN